MKQIALLILLLTSVTINAQNAEKKIAILEVIDRDENVAQGLKLMWFFRNLVERRSLYCQQRNLV